MKYRPIIQEVEASLYTPGMEDGIDCFKNGCGLFGQDCETCSWNTRTPYINTIDGKVAVTVQDYVVLLPKGKQVMTAEEFNELYEPLNPNHTDKFK